MKFVSAALRSPVNAALKGLQNCQSWTLAGSFGAVLCLICQSSAWAQNQPDPPVIEHEKRQGAEHRLQTFGTDLLGDGIDPHTGSISFSTTDVSIPGNFSLPVAITRKLSPGNHYKRSVSVEFGDWQIEVPRLHVVTRTGFDWTGNRCSNTFDQSFPAHQFRFTSWYRHQYTNGLKMEIPGQGSKDVLHLSNSSSSSSLFPSNAEMTTVDGWYLTCASANQGQGFIGHSPDGSKYRFDRFMTVQADPLGSHFKSTVVMARTRSILAATQVTDVNGNTVNYDYDTLGRLTAIHSSDNRRINLTYSGSSKIIQSVTANPTSSDARTWTYGYQQKVVNEHPINTGPIPNSLVSVTQPDGKSWSYDMGGMSIDPGPNDQCPQVSQTLNITHPYGVTGEFLLNEVRLRNSLNLQSNQALDCPGFHEVTPGNQPSILVLDRAAVMATSRKTLNGPGIDEHNWVFSYEQDTGPAGSSSGDRTNTSTVTEPSGRTIEYRHYWTAEPLGGKLASKSIKDGATVIRHEVNSYVQEPYGFGGSVNASGTTPRSTSVPTHTSAQTITQDGDTYTSTLQYELDLANSNYSWGRPLSTTSGASFTGTRTRSTTYEHNLTKWIHGLVKTTSLQGNPVESLTYDTNGRIATYSRFGVLQGTYIYHTDPLYLGSLDSVTNALGHTVSMTDYHRGKPRLVHRWDGVPISRTIDDNGWETSQTDAMTNVTALSHDLMGRLTQIDPPGSWANTDISYDFSGPMPRQIITKAQARTTVDYDSLFRPKLVLTQDLSSVWSSYVNTDYDTLGQVTFTSLPSNSSTETNGMTYAYDALGRKISEQINSDPATTYAYASGHRTLVTDPLGNVTTTHKTGYDGPDGGQPTLIEQPEGVSTIINRNIWGEVETVTQQGLYNGSLLSQQQRYYYDAQRRLCRTHTPSGGDTVFNYDAAGQMIAYAKAAPTATSCVIPAGLNTRVDLSYDALGRLKTTDFTDPATADILRYYDDNSNLKNIYRGGANWSYYYNTLNMPTYEYLDIDGRDYDLFYNYNSAGHLTQKNLPGGNVISYTPDGLGRIGHVSHTGSNLASNATYHPNGTAKNFTYGNGLSFYQTLNTRQQTDYIQHYDGGVAVLDWNYLYNTRGQITVATDNKDHTRDKYYYYDDLGRLTSAVGPWGASLQTVNANYSYDPLGNIRMKSVGARTVLMAYDGKNQLSSYTDTHSGTPTTHPLYYDGRGNVIHLRGMAMTYDMADQPRAISGGVSASYQYDGNLKRVKSVADGKTIYNVYDLSGALVHVDEVTDATRTDYVTGPNGPLMRIENGNYRYLHADHLGSPHRVSNASGTILANFEEVYSPYGMTTYDNSANDNQAGFTGHIRDKATGLNYMQARYYDPLLGRFLSVDPVTFMDTGKPEYFNRYSYTANDPINFTDPDGRTTCPGSPECSANNISTSTEVTTTTNANGSATDSRQHVEFNRVSDTEARVTEGSVTRLPQASNNGAPAVVSGDMQESLLNFSESEGGTNIEVTSGLRTPAQNQAVGGAGNSNHLSTNNAQAADIRISGQTATETANAANSSGEFNRVNEYTNGRGVHVDLRPTGNQGRFRDWVHQPDP